jgi:hypothetical protein
MQAFIDTMNLDPIITRQATHLYRHSLADYRGAAAILKTPHRAIVTIKQAGRNKLSPTFPLLRFR